ncbi:MAG: adenylate cyclase [Saprospiraceae bacterium]|jgi:adenylate cyclase
MRKLTLCQTFISYSFNDPKKECKNVSLSMKSKNIRRLAAVMFTDIVGYTALMQENESSAAAIRTLHRKVFDQEHQLYNGEIIQYFGDGTLSVFQSGVEAVECAIAIQKELNSGEIVPLRVGLHLGDIVFDGTDIYGDGVNLASRIESMGVAGAILLSGKLNDELKNQSHISTQSLGVFELKNITKPTEVFAIKEKGIKIPKKSELKGKQKAPTKTIAVLPFVNFSSSEENEYFSDGMTEEIINALAKIKELKVTSRTSSFFFKNKKIPISQIGKELNVSTILEGSIRLSGNKMRITAQLIDVADDFHFWSETFNRSMDDVFAVQDEISLLIADKLREHLGHFEIENNLVDVPDIPVATYQLYLKGRYFLMKLTRSSTEKAITIFEEVIAAQPNFPLPYLDINQGYTFLGTMGLMPTKEAFIKAKPFLDKALELDDSLPKSQINLSWICSWQNWDFEGAYQHILKAMELRPTDETYLTMSNLLAVEGKFDAALNYIDKALQIDPFSAMHLHFKGFIFYLQEEYEKAVPFFEKSLSIKPHLPFPNLYIGEILLLRGRPAEALTFFQNLPDKKGGDLTKLGGMAMAYAAIGDMPKTEAHIRELEAKLQTDSIGSAMNFLILLKTMMGKHDEAIKMLEQAIDYRMPLVLLLYTEPIIKPLHSLPRFQELMRQVFGKETIIDLSKNIYKKSLLDRELIEQYKNQLNVLMTEEKPYLNPDLTLRVLAEMIEIPPNHLSQLLNEGFNKNFSKYINTYRLETFKSKVADSSLQHLTILGLAYESGFNSKTVFNTFFKKAMGKTPKAYWKEVVK